MLLIFVVVAMTVQIAPGMASTDEPQYYTVYYNSSSTRYFMLPGEDTKNGLAWGYFDDNYQKNGWQFLYIASRSSDGSMEDDTTRAAAVGYLEGALTHSSISSYFQNLNYVANTEVFPDSQSRSEVYSWLETQQNWTSTQINTYKATSDYWQQIELIQYQLEGLYQGYSDYSSQTMEKMDFVFLNSFPDVLDIVNVVNDGKHKLDYFSMSPHQAKRVFTTRTHCSAFVKYAGQDLLVGHTTWIFYSMMNRIYKVFSLDFSAGTVGNYVSMSSYSGQIASADDWYVVGSSSSSGPSLVVMETSLSIANPVLYDLVVPQSLLSWQRTTAANRMSGNGPDWYRIFEKYNSGTYNNEWMVVDYAAYNKGSKENILWVVEQIPGKVEGGDQSSILLDTSYWASYNIPFYPDIYNITGYGLLEKQFGTDYSYSECPRAQIFRRNSTDVSSLDDLKQLMRYNRFQTDPLSGGDPGNAIASRFDLERIPDAFGGTDSKVTSKAEVASVQAWAIYGPTTQDQSPFSWSAFPSASHVGQPETFNFPWLHIQAPI